MKIVSYVFILIFFLGCSDDAYITHYDKKVTHLSCLKLKTKDILLLSKLSKLYSFDENCAYELRASQKSGIVCNSNQNAPKKALSNFPHGFLRLDIYGKKEGLIYSYYLDTDNKVSESMIEKGFHTIKEEFGL